LNPTAAVVFPGEGLVGIEFVDGAHVGAAMHPPWGCLGG
jgi:hypothetical protein